MSKTKFPRAEAIAVAKILVSVLQPHCERLIVAGSLRRRKQEVGDIEILYIPKTRIEPDGLFDTKTVNCANWELDSLLRSGAISKRLNVRGSET